MPEPKWIACGQELPPVVESFNDGTNAHGSVEGWFPNFARHQRRDTYLFTHPDTGPRWMVSYGGGYGKAKEPPTHWRHYPGPPDG